MGAFILGVLPITLAIAWFLAPSARHERADSAPVLPALKTAVHSRATRMLLAADLAVGIKIGLFLALILYVFSE